MEYIKKQIYTLPEIRRITKPLWSAWIVTACGAACGVPILFNPNISDTAASNLIWGVVVGACSLLLTLCYYAFGDSRRPYHKTLHQTLEPTLVYYPLTAQQQLTSALEDHDEEALAKVKKSAHPELILMRYSDKADTIFYSQLLRNTGSKQPEPLTEIIINDLTK